LFLVKNQKKKKNVFTFSSLFHLCCACITMDMSDTPVERLKRSYDEAMATTNKDKADMVDPPSKKPKVCKRRVEDEDDDPSQEEEEDDFSQDEEVEVNEHGIFKEMEDFVVPDDKDGLAVVGSDDDASVHSDMLGDDEDDDDDDDDSDEAQTQKTDDDDEEENPELLAADDLTVRYDESDRYAGLSRLNELPDKAKRTRRPPTRYIDPCFSSLMLQDVPEEERQVLEVDSDQSDVEQDTSYNNNNNSRPAAGSSEEDESD
jgi:hypothetical protein